MNHRYACVAGRGNSHRPAIVSSAVVIALYNKTNNPDGGLCLRSEGKGIRRSGACWSCFVFWTRTVLEVTHDNDSFAALASEIC